ncbi:spore cortex biosynthesis protein YabQ [Neopoerus faecalis]|uniref:spore cortex biosynthesis protein YabQ n=1 Tax=Neopoerus faecalis TaxID=3032125 RepID=UPI002570CD54|nr:spore cortex biosynthesis protein YabQ [Neopoerus faecalis]
MEIQITEQLRSFLLAILLGMAVGVVYDLMRAVRLRHPRLTAVLDLGCCLFAAGGLFLFLMRQTDGQLRGYILLGAVGGAVSYFSAASAALRPVWDFWLDRAGELYRLLSLPVRWGMRGCKKIAEAAKNLFYFWKKYVTILWIHRDRVSRRKGGGPHGKKSGRGRKKKKRQSVGTSGASAGAGGVGLAAVRAAGRKREGPGGA